MTSDAVWAERLSRQRSRWLVTGVAGFIGANLLARLLEAGQSVVGLDNFATGHRENLQEVLERLPNEARSRFQFIEGDIRDLTTCRSACAGIDWVLHQAALGSVPRSIADPIATNAANVDGFLNVLVAARDNKVKRFVFAASSSTYGDEPNLPKREDRIGRPLSPYAVTKFVNELYAEVFGRSYGIEWIGLRYFNVFGPFQDPLGAYAAVIPRWIKALLTGEDVFINGDGETSRDFCFVENAVQANVLAALTTEVSAVNQVYNVAVGQSTTLNGLFEIIRRQLAERFPELQHARPRYQPFREGDVRHSLADIGKAQRLLGYSHAISLEAGLAQAMGWYVNRFGGALQQGKMGPA